MLNIHILYFFSSPIWASQHVNGTESSLKNIYLQICTYIYSRPPPFITFTISCKERYVLCAPVTRQHVVSLSQSSYVSLVELTDGRGGGRVGEEPNHTIARMPGPLCNIQYSPSRRMIGKPEISLEEECWAKASVGSVKKPHSNSIWPCVCLR